MFSATMNRVLRTVFRPRPSLFCAGFQPSILRLSKFSKARSGRGRRSAAEALEVRMLLSAISVTNTLDDGSEGSLRWAIDQANSNQGPETISFDPTFFAIPQTITLTAGHLNLNSAAGIIINGPAAGVSISGNNASAVFDVGIHTTATLTGLTITNGKGTGANSDYTGGLVNLGTTTLIGCNIVGNTVTVAREAAGLMNSGTMTLIGCNVSGNSVFDRSISCPGGLANVGTMSIINSTVSDNIAPYMGGISNYGTMALTNATISSNGCTNAYGGVGGIASFGNGHVTMTNCTISDNASGEFGFSGDGGFGNYENSQAKLVNTIVAGNLGQDIDNSRYYSTDTANISGSNNLIGSGSTTLIDGVNGNIVGVTDPLLAPLGNYGGLTQTMSLLPGSPALNAGAGGQGVPSTDQRGQHRIGHVDIGAFESEGFKFSAISGTPQQSNIGEAFSSPLAVSVTANNPLEPVDGGAVTFVNLPAPNHAAAITFSPSATISAGKAAVTAMPNNRLGIYTVLAGSGAGNSAAAFKLTNTGLQFPSLAVNTTSDSWTPGLGLLSLREAIAFAGANTPGVSLITFDPKAFAAPQTITLTNGQLELTAGTDTIVGPAVGVTISGGGVSRVLQIDAGVTANLSHLTITQGRVIDNGGGIENFGHLVLDQSVVSGNTTFTNGGGIDNFGYLMLDQSVVTGNTALTNGGGIENFGHLMLDHSTVTGNTASTNGGGIDSNGPASTLNVQNSTISSNTADGRFPDGLGGGGIAIGNHSVAIISNSIIIGNQAASFGGGIFNNATTTLSNSKVSGNSSAQGGGIRNNTPGSMTISFSTIEGNQATLGNGGGISSSGTLNVDHSSILSNQASNGLGGGIRCFAGIATVVDATLVGNSAAEGGGMSFDNSSGTLTNCTVSGNTADDDSGGLITSSSNVTLINSILAGNTDTNGNPGDIGQFSNVSGTNNLIGLGGEFGLTNGVAGNILGVANPLLGPLGFYGGPTETIPLLPGSPALNAGTKNKNIPVIDQRGRCRMGGIDIGAFQSQGFTLTIVPGSIAQTTLTGTAFKNPLKVSVKANDPLEPVEGGVITFSTSTSKSGASATLSSQTAVISGGKASVNATANNNVGLYTAVASGGKSNKALFVLNNVNHPIR